MRNYIFLNYSKVYSNIDRKPRTANAESYSYFTVQHTAKFIKLLGCVIALGRSSSYLVSYYLILGRSIIYSFLKTNMKSLPFEQIQLCPTKEV